MISQWIVAIGFVLMMWSVVAFAFSKNNYANHRWPTWRKWSWFMWTGWVGFFLWVFGLVIH